MERLRHHRCTATRGFTLVELLVVLGIIIAITGIVATGQNSFNKTLILANTAYDVALSLRSAETYGLGGKAIGTAPVGYGVHFDVGGTSAKPSSYILFADVNPPLQPPTPTSACHGSGDSTSLGAQPGNCSYESGDTAVSNYALGNGMTISDFCAYASPSWTCTTAHDGAGGGLTSLDIVFARPNPDALMSMGVGGAATTYSPSITRACLTVFSPQGGSRFVSIQSSGQIDANASSCPLP